MALFGGSGKGKSEAKLDQVALERLVREQADSQEITQLREKIEALTLLLKRHLKLSEAELDEALKEVRRLCAAPAASAAETLQASGPLKAVGPCPTCGRARSAKTGLCPYCGADKETQEELKKRFGN
jgi:hypothetical protein